MTKICPLVAITTAIYQLPHPEEHNACIKEKCEFWTTRIIHNTQKPESGCAFVLSVTQKLI
jgi:hypothetical protein